MKPWRNYQLVMCMILFLLAVIAADDISSGSIVFTTLGRSSYSFDIYSQVIGSSDELRLTDGNSVNYNGVFPSRSSISSQSETSLHLIYVTERNGSSNIFLDSLEHAPGGGLTRYDQIPLLRPDHGGVSMEDKPSLVGEYLVYASTQEDSGAPRTSWTAVYSTHLKTGLTRRLTPHGIADFSPAVSPSGKLTAVASGGEKGWGGELEELDTDIYIFSTRDGSNRVKAVEHGGWPSWADDSTFYFHRRCEDGWWSVFSATLPSSGELSTDSVVTQRVTPPGMHAFTPAASVSNPSFIAVATRRSDSDFRHIEIYDLRSNEFKPLTRPLSPHAHHFNPFISPDSNRVGYHRCRGSGSNNKKNMILENLQNPLGEDVSLLRIDGAFPSFSPDGNRIAYLGYHGVVYVINSDGSGLREVFTKRFAFTTAWDWKRKGVVYTSTGPIFSGESTGVDIISINVDDESLSFKQLTKPRTENNAFPSPSPDGKWVVFRSGRTGHKNLYVMDAVEGESGGIYRLTQGEWTDTMPNWSRTGEWIVFVTDRENPGSGRFELYLIRPNGTGLHKVFQGGSGGRASHPWFSPDGKYIVFTSDYAAVSAEPIATPHQFQPYGEMFVINSDGSGHIRRLTHDSYEDGTPAWGPKLMRKADVEWPNEGTQCIFDDCEWLSIISPSRNKVVKFGDKLPKCPHSEAAAAKQM